MKKGNLCFIFILFLAGCAQNEFQMQAKHEYENEKRVSWEFLKEKGWQETAAEDWTTAKIEKVIADENYEYLAESYLGKEVVEVTFECREDAVVCPQPILIDPKKNEVIGYMRGE